jgi:hypothetical protein
MSTVDEARLELMTDRLAAVYARETAGPRWRGT